VGLDLGASGDDLARPRGVARRQPVIENAFEKPLITTVSFLIFSFSEAIEV
jgi:hypothetical protein